MGNLLDTPKTDKLDCHLFTSSSGLNCGGVGMQGYRRDMEDTHVITDLPSLPDHLFVTVFDGHGGSGAANYAALNMVRHLEDTPQFQHYVAAQDSEKIELLGEALRQTFITTDDLLRAEWESASDRGSGCTAVVACVTPRYIICANAGDSRCVLGTGATTKPLSEDHKPLNEGELKRIEAAGGSVSYKRVDGDLAVSRALGDFQYKKRDDLPPEKQKVTCDPDITVHERTSSDDVLILACDGVWDVMSSHDCIELTRAIFASGESNMQLVAEEIVDVSMHKGSKDNISAVVVQLPGATIGPASGGGVMGRRKARKAVEEEKSNGVE